MRVLITGNMGYVGPVLVQHLRRQWPDAELIGYDSAFFAHNLTADGVLPERLLSRQVFGDVRDLPAELLQGVDAVVHLAAVSNDPMGNRFEEPTDNINYRASARLARMARDAGVHAFVFASSCSVYGFAEGGARKEGDALNPLTAYSRSKIATETALAEQDSGDMIVTCLRFATACGMSPRLRLDLVLNDFVAGAMATGEITVLSDGTPWRPLIDVADMARAIEWAIERDTSNGGQYLAVNAGDDARNHQVADLAAAVAKAVPGTKVSINPNAPPDKRSYQVDFALFRSLAPNHQPVMTLERSVERLAEGLKRTGWGGADFRTTDAMRLVALQRHLDLGRLTPDLRWAPTAF
jgi:nucleoside-diphosphate-sugar epimerase